MFTLPTRAAPVFAPAVSVTVALDEPEAPPVTDSQGAALAADQPHPASVVTETVS
jgi:hypothetical protein